MTDTINIHIDRTRTHRQFCLRHDDQRLLPQALELALRGDIGSQGPQLFDSFRIGTVTDRDNPPNGRLAYPALELGRAVSKAAVVTILEEARAVLNNTRRLAGFTHLPGPITATHAAALVTAWLSDVKRTPEPDHDGHNGEGWEVWATSEGVAVVAVWLEFHK